MSKKSIACLKKYVREKYFNKYIRLRDAVDGYITCCTCGIKVPWKEANAGHFQHGLDFIEENQHGQCVRCNKWLSGALDKYTLFMINKYGMEKVEELVKMKKTHKGYSRAEIEEIQEQYKEKLKKLTKVKE